MERFFSLQRASRRGIIPLLLLFLLIPQASGIGVGASPDRIEFGVVNLKEGAIRELYVINTGDEAERVMLNAEEVDITMDPQEFDLAAGEGKAVAVSIDQSKIEAGEYTGSILITARPSGDAGGGLGLGAGVRVSVTFVVKEDIYGKVMVAVGLFAVIAAALLLWVRRTKV